MKPLKPRRKYIHIELTDAQFAELASRAEALGQPKAEYVRRKIWPPGAVPESSPR